MKAAVSVGIAQAAGARCVWRVPWCTAVGDGAHANYMCVPVSTLVPLPDEFKVVPPYPAVRARLLVH